MNEKEFIEAFVSQREINDGNIKRESCLVRLLDDADRLYLQKDIIKQMNDCILDKNDHKLEALGNQLSDIPFLPLIGYLILLDLIGEVFTEKENKIINAIDCFGSDKLKQCKWVVYALRNSLAHNYGLINIPKNKKKDSNSLHKFTLSSETNKIEIFENRKKWKRNDWKDKSEATSTKVYVDELIKEIKELHKTLEKKVKKGEYNLYLSGGIEELKSRFTIIKTDINDNSNTVKNESN
jgi:hypothetical protein